MLYIKEGFPEVNEIVLCTVTKIYGNTTFVLLDEYEKEGVLTISEISPGRIRNLRDYVIENKKIVCKVLRVDKKQKRIDVSLRRVPIPVMKSKLEQIKKEEYAERVYEDVANMLGITKDELFEKTYEYIFDNFETVFEALYEIMLDNSKIQNFKKISKKEREIFLSIINQRIKPEKVTFKHKFLLHSLENNGVNIVKSVIKKTLQKINYDDLNIIYVAAGQFEIKINHDEIKEAQKIFDNFKTILESEVRKKKLFLKV